uniref:Uncharacterized protein n=1 Tax=Molossus molossus TaxID=27622 RepID=A0A7J8I8P5_MOLMO|nr:hypothetical protein HJG59_010721 [Molossus molossus]
MHAARKCVRPTPKPCLSRCGHADGAADRCVVGKRRDVSSVTLHGVFSVIRISFSNVMTSALQVQPTCARVCRKAILHGRGNRRKTVVKARFSVSAGLHLPSTQRLKYVLDAESREFLKRNVSDSR